MGHKVLQSTQIYFKLVDKNKDDSYSLDLPNSGAKIYCSSFYVRKQEIEGFEYIRISLNNTLYCDTLDEMGGFEEQFYPNACADEIEELSAILSVRDVVNNSIAAEDGFYFVLVL